MADILQRYGIKEVADVTFYHINKITNEPDYPVLVLDSLKVTSIEQTAETTEARGGKGNAKLIVWDFGKEITVNIEDALFSPKSLSIMFSDSRVLKDAEDTSDKGYIKKSARVVATENKAPTLKLDGKEIATSEVSDLKWYVAEEGKVELTEVTETTAFKKGTVYIATWMHPVAAKSIITITPDSFPGTYYVTGDTMIRSERSGEDEYFQFVIAKAKMQAEQTISMEAEGDPSTFNMSLQVLRPENGEMIKFIQYAFADDTVGDWDNNPETPDTIKAPALTSTDEKPISDGWTSTPKRSKS
jgi:hypothetical protein